MRTPSMQPLKKPARCKVASRNFSTPIRSMPTTLNKLSSCRSEEAGDSSVLFSHMAIKPLAPEQLYDSISRILVRRPQPAQRAAANNLSFDPRRAAFVARMQTATDSQNEFNAGVPQALTLMHGTEINEATDPQRSGLLGSLAAPFFNNEQRVEVLFLATMSRPPTPDDGRGGRARREGNRVGARW